jgi:hypothetical protein
MRKLYACIVIIVAVICIGIAVERYSTTACAQGVCLSSRCTSSAQCGRDCFCNIITGAKDGWCS